MERDEMKDREPLTGAELVRRLRGEYRIPINDGMGAVGAGDEPNNPDEFVMRFETAPIQHDAADRIEALEKALGAMVGYMMNAVIDLQTGTKKSTTIDTLNGGIKMANDALEAEGRQP